MLACFPTSYLCPSENGSSEEQNMSQMLLMLKRFNIHQCQSVKELPSMAKKFLPKLFENGSLAYKKKLAMENIWSKSEVFHFVSHPGMFGMAYPCVTTNDGSDPGKPCYFPFRYNYIFFR